MSRRLVLSGSAGDTIISTDPSETRIDGSAPTNASVRLWQHPDDPDYYRHFFDSSNNALTACRIAIQGTGGDPDGAATTVLDNLKAILRSIRGRTVKFEYKAGSARWTHPVFGTEDYDVEAELRAADGGNLRLDCRFMAVGFTPGPGDDDDSPDGATSQLVWTLSASLGGFFTARGQCEFETVADMHTWINQLKGGTHPAFMGSSFRFNTYEPEFRNIDGTAFVTVELKQQIPSLSGHADLQNLADFTFMTVRHTRGPNTRNGPEPGRDVTVSGTLHFKVGALTSFNSGDSIATSPTAVEDAADKAIDAILGGVQGRFPYELRELSRRGGMGARMGDYDFQVALVMPNDDGDELLFRERVRMRYDANGERGRRSDGSSKVWYPATGMDVMLTHEFTIRSFERPDYVVPEVNDAGKWMSVGGTQNDPKPEAELHESGEVIWNLEVTSEWSRIPSGEGDAIPPHSISQPLDLTLWS